MMIKIKALLSILCLLLILNHSTFAQEGLLAEYYNGENFESFVGKDTVYSLDFYWNEIPPISGLNPNFCSVRYTGQIAIPRTGSVTFSARVDDGIKLWLGDGVEDTLVLSNWQLNDVGIANGTIHLKSNTTYTIKIEYYNGMNEAELNLLWKLPEDPDQNWWSKWWNGDDFREIKSEYLTLPLDESKPVFRAE